MLWAIGEILTYMVVVAVLGALLGWVLRGKMGAEQAELSSLRAQLREHNQAQRQAKRAANTLE